VADALADQDRHRRSQFKQPLIQANKNWRGDRNMNEIRGKKAIVTGGAMLLLGVLLIAAITPEQFMEEKQKSRAMLNNTKWEQLGAEKNYQAAIFKDEIGKYDFKVTPEDRERLKAHLKSYLNCKDDALLNKMVDRLGSGHALIYKQDVDDGVVMKTTYLSPEAKYWEWLADFNKYEFLFHYYNATIELYRPQPNISISVVVTEGEFFGFRKVISMPVVPKVDEKDKSISYVKPTQAEMIAHLNNMPPVKPGRDKPEEKFIDACRTHLYFQQKDSQGRFMISDEDIRDSDKKDVPDIAEECEIKTASGHYQVHGDYPYIVMDIVVKAGVNLEAFLPGPLASLLSSLEDAVNSVTGELVVKFVPLFMRNFRDHTQEWTKTGGPQ
jgi:hypothetical protein